MRRAARIGAGMAMMTAGTVMLFTPGPGLLAIAGGLALMKDDVAWAGKAADWVKSKAKRVSGDSGEEAPSEVTSSRAPNDN